ncbi:MAG TPA: L,D-transpeptidase, partial [Bifidobacterium longum]|nr:L,D-transpeptidase [Bifidobacterium longum]
MVRLPTLNVNWSRDRVYVIRRGVVACCILFCLIGAGVETAAAQRSWPRADTATAAA